MPNLPERYLGDGVYAQLDEARQIVLKIMMRADHDDGHCSIALEPEVFANLINFARDFGFLAWDRTAERAYTVGDTDYTRAEEDAQRKRDAAEGFDED